MLNMQHALFHRGPDGQGEYINEHVHLGMTRLSVIDLNTGWQPIYNEDKSLLLFANGEIYNYIELRDKLAALGHKFTTHGDCEAIIHLYEEYGFNFVHSLRGMFSFCLYDKSRQRILLVRDRVGEKPLYLYEEPGVVVFASELKALLKSGYPRFSLDPRAINHYFHYQFVPEPLTPVKGIRKLSAGQMMVIDISTWDVQSINYWSLENAPPLDGDPAALIADELDEISQLIVRSDVPVGVALSGGLDSSAIAALAVSKYPGTIVALSAGYKGSYRNDERADAKQVADYLHIPFHEIVIGEEDVVDSFPSLVFWQDDPIADIAGYGYFAIMRKAKELGIKVMLQGQGGDELFWGYPWARQAVRETFQKLEFIGKDMSFLRDYLKLESLPSWSRWDLYQWALSTGGIRSSYERYRRHKDNPNEQIVFYDVFSDFIDARREMASYYTDNFINELGNSRPEDLFTFQFPWDDPPILITRLLFQTYLVENGIAQGDRLSMASSVELRLPLLDYRLVETVIGLRKRTADYLLPSKYWLKEAIRHILPSWVLNRPKRGFAPPVREWHRMIFSEYGKKLKNGYLVDQKVLKPEKAELLAKGGFPLNVRSPLSFKALVLELWCQNLIA